MRTTTSAIRQVNQELEEVAQSLWRSIAANRNEEALQLIDRCVAMHSAPTHDTLISILERARRLAIAQRSFASVQLANVESAIRYRPDPANQKHHVTRA